ncbi:MAG: hypothetical protein JWO47_1086 [Candidatus Saccharibacteria bacterium]|nr:hypothetical protein [Candidatus Saccharibacteria bacterium]
MSIENPDPQTSQTTASSHDEELPGMHESLDRVYDEIYGEAVTPVLDQAPDFQHPSTDAQSDELRLPTTRIEQMEDEINSLYDQYQSSEPRDPTLLKKIAKLHEEIFWRREGNDPGKPI